MIALAQPTPFLTVKASTGQLMTQAPHSIQAFKMPYFLS
jgi:hypothetical protein